MLRQLTILDFALVARLDIGFADGLTVVTGESGAGKSILMNALALVLGERASADLIRPGAARAEVAAEFDLAGNRRALDYLGEHELADAHEPERCLARRVIGRDGRSRAFINGAPVTLQVLRDLTDGLLDIHGQGENQRLTRRDVQLDLLDAYGVAAADRRGMAQAHRAWRRTEKALQALKAKVANAAQRASLLGYQLDELRTLNLAHGEFESMQGEFRRLSQAQSIHEAVQHAIERLSDLADARQAERQLGGIDDDHPSLLSARQALGSAVELVDDAVRDLSGYIDAFEMDPDHLAQLSERLDRVQDLARKHRCPPERLAQQVEHLEREFNTLHAGQDELQGLQAETERQKAEFERIAGSVSQQRRQSASGFAAAVSARMNALGIKGGALDIRFEAANSERGLETLEFHVTTNPKYPAGSLAKIASGGERARIDLAVCVVAAQRAQLPSLVLDEADVGVGGATADVLGRMLRDLGARTQVLCVTHAPQVAALGDNHLVVEKDAAQDVHLRQVTAADRVEEVARMLAGADLTDETRAYARTLLDGAERRTGSGS